MKKSIVILTLLMSAFSNTTTKPSAASFRAPDIDYGRIQHLYHHCPTGAPDEQNIAFPNLDCRGAEEQGLFEHRFRLSRFFLKQKSVIKNSYGNEFLLREKRLKSKEVSLLVVQPKDDKYSLTSFLGVYIINNENICIGYALLEDSPYSFEDVVDASNFQLIKSLNPNPAYLQGKLNNRTYTPLKTYEETSDGYTERYITFGRTEYGELLALESFFPTELESEIESEIMPVLDENIKNIEYYDSQLD